jgi:hypothetical protein
MRQSLDPAINALVWNGLPTLHWRYTGSIPKPASEVLAWAQPSAGSLGGIDARYSSPEAQRAAENSAALIVAGRYGLGRSVLINFDSTWRLRYGVGDVYHHAFWGQILRWGTGENLRAGNDLIRLGSDRLSYRAGADVKVMAKLLNEAFQPIAADDATVSVFKDQTLVNRQPLNPRIDSNGVHEAVIKAPKSPGRYRLVLEGESVRQVLAAQSAAPVETELIVDDERNAIEYAELTAAPAYLRQLAALSGGAVASPGEAASLLPFFRAPGRISIERQTVTLWDNFGLLIPLLLVLGTEWLLRRKEGLP